MRLEDLSPRRWPRWALVLVPPALGAVIGLGQLPFDLPWLALAGFALVFLIGAPKKFWPAFGRGWLLALGYFALTLQWITQPFLVEAETFGWMAPFGLILMAAGLALFWGLAFGLVGTFGLIHGNSRRLALVLALALMEMLRSRILTGFPWALPGHIWIGHGFGQTAAWWGAHGLTLMTLAAGCTIGLGLRLLPRARGWALVAAPPLAIALTGVAMDPGPAPAVAADAPLVRIVQPNVAQAAKTDPAEIPLYTRRLIDLSAAPGNDGPPALVVWPETSWPGIIDYLPEVLPTLAAAAQGGHLAIGIQRRDGPLYYNSMALISPEAQVTEVYDKHHLVPFGEYVPLGDLAARFGIRGLAAADGAGYAFGAGPGLMDIPGIGLANPLICYEGIFAEEVAAAPGRARFLLLITNDAWFGDFAGPYQHFALGRLRAIEQGLPMVRAANTGVSAMIDGRGRIIAELGLGQTGYIDVRLPPALPPTPYARVGDWPVALLILIAMVLGYRRWQRVIDRSPLRE